MRRGDLLGRGRVKRLSKKESRALHKRLLVEERRSTAFKVWKFTSSSICGGGEEEHGQSEVR